MNMGDCSKHIVPEYLSNLEQVAEDILDMPYDKVAELFGYMEKKSMKDSNKDGEGGRTQLSLELSRTSFSISIVKEHFQRIWKLCKPYMTK